MNDKFFLVVAYLLATNIFAFMLFGYDKWCSQHDRWRVRESTLLMWSAIGGSLGACLAMGIFHHKTLHLKFKFGVPFLLCLHAVIAALIYVNPANFMEKIFGIAL